MLQRNLLHRNSGCRFILAQLLQNELEVNSGMYTTHDGGSMKQLFTLMYGIILAGALVAAAQTTRITIADTAVQEKPYLVVSPGKPVARTDTVIMQIMVGTASNSCMAPAFSNTSFTIQESNLAVYPPNYTVLVKFTRDPPPEDKICTSVYAPVDYGPRFFLGPLSPGMYQVVQDVGDLDIVSTVYGRFVIPDPDSISPALIVVKGTVVDDPSPLKRASMPVPRASIYLLQDLTGGSVGASIDRLIATGLRDSTMTDEKGHYSFIGMGVGAYIIACRHPDFRPASAEVTVRGDTTVNFTLVPASASASVGGVVSEFLAGDAKTIPMEGCTLLVTKDPVIMTATSAARIVAESVYRAVTDKNGAYLISDIPISSNGEQWGVLAYGNGYREVKTVHLYNSAQQTVDFTLSKAYSNNASVTFGEATFTTASDKYIYRENDPVRIRYTITNPSRSDMKFGPFSGRCEYDLIITAGTDRRIYQASAQPVACLDTIATIVVEAGQTVTHDFPAWYSSDLLKTVLGETMVAPRSIKLNCVARLRGKDYDSTLASVPVTIEFAYPLGTVTGQKNINATPVSFNAAANMLSFNFDKPQRVSVNVYTLEGAMIPLRDGQRQFSAGMHTLSLQNMLQNRRQRTGVYIIGVRGNGFEERFSAIRMTR
jgi:hypothetical protein